MNNAAMCPRKVRQTQTTWNAKTAIILIPRTQRYTHISTPNLRAQVWMAALDIDDDDADDSLDSYDGLGLCFVGSGLGLLSGVEFLSVLLVVGALFLLSIRLSAGARNVVFLIIVTMLIIGLIYLSKVTMALLGVILFLTALVALLVILFLRKVAVRKSPRVQPAATWRSSFSILSMSSSRRAFFSPANFWFCSASSLMALSIAKCMSLTFTA